MPPPDGAAAPRQQAQVWHDNQVERWHAVVVRGDSVTGIPFLQAITCDSCRVALPRQQVDSIRFGNPTLGFWKTVGLVVAVPTVFLVIYCYDAGGAGCRAGS